MKELKRKWKQILNGLKSFFSMKWFLLIAVLLLAGAIYYLLTHYGPRYRTQEDLPQDEVVIEEAFAETSYATETSFDGTKELDPLVFAYPFQKTEEFYISNKDLVKILSQEKLEGLQQRATEFIIDYYYMDSRVLISEYTEKEDQLQGYYPEETQIINEKGESVKTDVYVADYLLNVAEAELQTEVTFTTDKCLVFEDVMGYFVRGIMEIKVYNCNRNSDFSNFIPWEVEEGNTYKAIVDVSLVPEDSRAASTYRISQVEIVDLFVED